MSSDWKNWNLSYLPDVFGPLFGPSSVKQAMVRTLELWLPSYIAEINRQLGAPVLVVPQDYLYQPDERAIAARSSQVMVTVPGTISTERKREGTRATFDARVTLFFGGTQDWNESEFIGQAYAVAAMAAIAQHPSLGDFAETTMWTGLKLGAEKRSSTVWRYTCINHFSVVVTNVMSPFGGPPVPSVAAPAAVPTVTSENIKVAQLS